MIEYGREPLSDCLEEIKPLLEGHWEEVALNQDKVKLCPDYDTYEVLHNQELLICTTVRDSGKLVGYLLFFIYPHLHYKNSKFAVSDVLFLLPEYRMAKVGLGLVKYAEESLKADGVDVINIGMRAHAPFESLCEGLGYTRDEIVYSKYVGE